MKEGDFMIYTVGTWWAVGYFIFALIGIVVGICWGLYNRTQGEKPVGGIICFAFGLVMVWFWIFAATHFRVNINERSLLINTVNQTVIGTRESGVQGKPLLGVSTIDWPAQNRYKVEVVMQKGVASATAKGGTSLQISNIIYLDLSKTMIAEAYRSCNGNWDVFFEKNLIPDFMSVARNVSQNYTPSEHTFKRDAWEKEYEDKLEALFSDPKHGYGIKIVKGTTIMSWGFSNEADEKAYDDSNRVSYSIDQKNKELEALKIDSAMVDTRNEMLKKTANGTIANLQAISDYLKSQPADIRPYLMDYLANMADMEYLRIVGQEKPDMILPPHGGSVIAQSTPKTAVTPQTSENKDK